MIIRVRVHRTEDGVFEVELTLPWLQWARWLADVLTREQDRGRKTRYDRYHR